MLDNVADLLLTVGLLAGFFGFPTKFALQHMVPGTSIGVLVGDLLFFVMALKLARKTGRNDITAMPLGLDTPSTFGMVFFVLGPAFSSAKQTLSVEQAAVYTWHIGICAIFISGVFKLACAFVSDWVRKTVPRAGLLGSLTAIALVLISFLPLIEILHFPVVGLVSLSVILTTLVAKVSLPARIPGTLGALLISGGLFYLMRLLGLIDHAAATNFDPSDALLPHGWLAVFTFEWTGVLGDSLRYLPVVLPFALATVIGGIDCTESAAASGDEYSTGQVVGVEAIATLAASLCGGVIQTTPYIGHPAYKAMGGRSAYVLATALFVGGAGLVGYFAYLYVLIPKAAVFPILVFIGLEITAQSFQATPRRHLPAVALACLPAMAALVLLYVDNLLGELSALQVVEATTNETIRISSYLLSSQKQTEILTIRVLANGFILTSMLWGGALAEMIDGRLRRAAVFFVLTGFFSLFGVIHSPLEGGPVFLPWTLPAELRTTVLRFAAGYGVAAVLLWIWTPVQSELMSRRQDAGSNA